MNYGSLHTYFCEMIFAGASGGLYLTTISDYTERTHHSTPDTPHIHYDSLGGMSLGLKVSLTALNTMERKDNGE